ncbi:hypothetical protein GCM10011390_20350 [Aureimonas endophytica]|uniref:Uncharacterized protein n=1 Tax=Aureimonas endophytica TaxID=2027858 RepID=A0A916ZJT5_9HYPH|nr:hypothetical protein GCM10011390_20350 [Aureimonas endophytica]
MPDGASRRDKKGLGRGRTQPHAPHSIRRTSDRVKGPVPVDPTDAPIRWTGRRAMSPENHRIRQIDAEPIP